MCSVRGTVSKVLEALRTDTRGPTFCPTVLVPVKQALRYGLYLSLSLIGCDKLNCSQPD